ncbi:MAG: ATP-binding protein [Dactylosporangium sp.]|nr:ATP-binding protein [Dactylosporangium sp.]
MFDRTWEWGQLIQFARDDTPGATLGLVYGRRRQGKSFLLDALAESTTGLYLEATRDVETRTLTRLGVQIGQFLGSPAPLTLPDWEAAIDALLALGRRRPLTVVLDEFPYLLAASPPLASVIQSAYGPRRPQRLESQTRLILCGSALSVMRNLMTGQAPLRGRASLELQVDPFDYRTAREFWNITDVRTAVLVHAICGGTPAYRDLIRSDIPGGPENFDAWVARAVLNPASPLHREARYLFSEDLDVREPLIYHSILATVADGETTRGKIASGIGRKTTDIGQALQVLEDTGFLTKNEDAFAQRKPTWHIADPIMAFHYAVTRPVWQRLQRPGRAEEIWAQRQSTFAAQVLGPHFEHLCRQWAREFADPATFRAETIAEVSQGVLHAGRNASYEIDVAVFGPGGKHRRLLSIGEAKWGEVMGTAHLARLREAMTWLADRTTLDMSTTIPACYSAAGFTSELHAAAAAGEVVLVDLNRLYHGA